MKKIGILVKKEMTEILRDKKTLIIMVLMPLILYPVLMIGLTIGLNFVINMQDKEEHVVGYQISDADYVAPIIDYYDTHKEDLELNLSFVDSGSSSEADVWISFSGNEDNVKIEAEYTSTNQVSGSTESDLEDLIDNYTDAVIEQNLAEEGLTKEFLTPVTYKAVDTVSTSESIGLNMGGSIGMMLVVMILMGAFYPAVDVTAGEKERGTLETLLTLPVTNFEMIMSKFISVSVFASVTALLSLVALGGSVVFMFFAIPADSASETLQIPLDVFLSGVPVLLIALIATALLITAFSMCFCVFAKSSKEANNYMTPVMLVVMLASMIGMIPTVELNYTFAIIPFINITLLIKQVLGQQLDIYLAFVTIMVNIAYSIITVWVLAKMYDSEDVMFSDGFRSFRLFQKRGDIKKNTIPAMGDVLLCVVVLYLAMTYVGGFVSARDMFLGTIVSQIMIFVLPMVLTWYMKTDKKQLFYLNKPDFGKVPGAILFYIGSYVLATVIRAVLTNMFPESAQNVNISFDEIFSHPFIIVVLVVALMPAVGEELLFRGLIYGSMKHKYSVVWAIVISSVVFGVFHGSIVRILPTGILGACFAYVLYKTNSIYVTSCMHFFNNFIAIVASTKPELMQKILPILTKETLSISEMIIMLVVGVACLAVGFLLMNIKNNKEKVLSASV